MRGHPLTQMLERHPPRVRRQGRGGEKPGGMGWPGKEAFAAATAANPPCPGAGPVGHSSPQLW
jgi:hypothetical protein